MERLALNISEAAQKSGIGRTRLYEEISAGNLPARKIGRRTVILCEDLERWLRGLPSADFGQATAT